MNVHHLELFYYVAKHGGIMPAVRNIPYGIQQPAVSAQVAQLEGFYPAEAYHQNYFDLHPNEPYIVYNDRPKVEALKARYPQLYVEKARAAR